MKLIHSDHVFAVGRFLKGKVTLVDLPQLLFIFPPPPHLVHLVHFQALLLCC